MADNNVNIIITAVNKAKGAFNELHGDLTRLKEDGKATKAEIAAAGAAIVASITAIGVTAVSKFADFEASMSKVKAVTDISGKAMDDMTALARELGRSTVFTAKEVADAMAELGQAGFSAKEIMEGIPATLDLAAAGGLGIARATEIASSTLRGFQIETKDTTRVVDIMAATAATSNATIEDFGDSMKYLAPTAHAFGISIEEASAVVGILSNAGIKGSLATRALGTSLANLTKPTDAMMSKMEELNFTAFDAQGQFVGMTGLVGNLEKSLQGLTQEQRMAAISTLFGAESIQEINVLLAAGSDELGRYTEQLENSDGEAKRMAATMLDNVKGAFEQLSGAVDDLWISLGQMLAPTVRFVAEGLTVLANAIGRVFVWFETLPAPIQTFVKVAVGIATLLLVLVGGWAAVTFAMSGFFTALGTIIAGVASLAGGFLPLIAIIALVAAAVAGLMWAWDTNFLGIRDVTATAMEWIRQAFTSFIEATKALFAEWWPIIVAAFENLWIAAKFIFDAWMLFQGGWIMGMINVIRNGWDNIFRILKAALDLIFNTFMFVWNAIAGLVKMTLQIIGGDFSGAWQTWTETTEKMGENLKNIFLDIWTIIKETIIGALEAVWSFFTGWWDNIFGKLQDLWGWITNLTGAVSEGESNKRAAARGGNKTSSRKYGGMLEPVPAFARSGILQGARGTDTTPFMGSPGEIILNYAHQAALASALRGRAGGGEIHIHVENNEFNGGGDEFAETVAEKIWKMAAPHIPHEAF